MGRVSHEYMKKHLGSLVGLQVRELAIDDSEDTLEEFGAPVYGLIFSDSTTAWIMCDPEGNGPGFLDIAPGGK